MTEDFYELLGVARKAGDDDIKKAYRKLARELHPDANPGDKESEERFKLVTVAYETLRDPERRRRYDTYGIDGLRASPGGAGRDPFAGFSGGLGDLFEAFFGGSPFGGAAGARGGRQSGPPRGADAEVTLGLAFEEAVFGADKEVTVRTAVACGTCSATGAQPGTSVTTCVQCAGAGEVRTVRQSILGQMVTARPCPRCSGLGQQISSPCEKCRGEGRVTEARTFTVPVPAGVDTGNTLRLDGRGPAGPRGGRPGDLYVHLDVAPHARFRRQGNDLVHELHLPFTAAALGSHLAFETLDGPEDLVVPAGAQSGRVFRLRGRGVPHVEGRGRGDVLVQVVVDTPTDLTQNQERLLRELAAERGEEVNAPDTGLLSKIRSAFK
ncbi:MAG: molecular chaperone DnaJ [Acidimicrobiales bacterium]